MNMHQSELVRQQSEYKDVRGRLFGNAPKKEKAIVVKGADESALIASLQRDKRCLEVELKEARQSLRYVAEKERVHRETEKRLEKLELDLADARARILSQAELMKNLDDSEAGEMMDKRRPVHEIVAEVLQHYPGITWEDVKGIRRTRDLIAPRHACMRAVYNERKDLSSPRIGKIFGRDHSTLLHAVKKDYAPTLPQE
jgi:chromosomal replication initiation ATPase DnaA